jgi:hypothetical protein
VKERGEGGVHGLEGVSASEKGRREKEGGKRVDSFHSWPTG